jgi:deoxyribodipyrimidine photo-lyase
MPGKINLFWFRRDLRLHDNHGLYQALSAGLPVLPFFIFDRNILDELTDRNDPRVQFIYQSIQTLRNQLEENGAAIEVRYGIPLQVMRQLVQEYKPDTVFTNHDYEPYARNRDEEIKNFLEKAGIKFRTFKDQVIFERAEISKDNGMPYQVFTPYANKWRSLIAAAAVKEHDIRSTPQNFVRKKNKPLPSLEEMDFSTHLLTAIDAPDESVIKHYDKTRDLPSIQGTSRAGIHLRFGTVSVRQLVKKAMTLNATFLNELIWREFFMQWLWHEPRLVHECFKTEYEHIRWRNNESEFERWCAGQTGYPIVDAGMRELNETGFMHNRVRMITASFLVKHLLVDWRWGEAYFAKKLLDYELASNSGNWQWVAGCGCDAAPYFRIFNPAVQTTRFDPAHSYISKWVPEWQSEKYPLPIINHEIARARCLETYKQALRGKVK